MGSLCTVGGENIAPLERFLPDIRRRRRPLLLLSLLLLALLGGGGGGGGGGQRGVHVRLVRGIFTLRINSKRLLKEFTAGIIISICT